MRSFAPAKRTAADLLIPKFVTRRNRTGATARSSSTRGLFQMSKEPKTPSGFHDKFGNPIPMENFDNDFDSGLVTESMKPLFEQFRRCIIGNKPTAKVIS